MLLGLAKDCLYTQNTIRFFARKVEQASKQNYLGSHCLEDISTALEKNYIKYCSTINRIEIAFSANRS